MDIVHIPPHRFDLTYQYLLPVLTKTRYLYQDECIKIQEISISDIEQEKQEGVIFRGSGDEPKPFVACFREAIVVGWCEGNEEECVKRVKKFLEKMLNTWNMGVMLIVFGWR